MTFTDPQTAPIEDLAVEKAIASACVWNPGLIERHAAGMKAGDFLHEHTRLIFEASRALGIGLSPEPANPIEVMQWIKDHRHVSATCEDLVMITLTRPEHDVDQPFIDRQCRRLREYANLREIYRFFSDYRPYAADLGVEMFREFARKIEERRAPEAVSQTFHTVRAGEMEEGVAAHDFVEGLLTDGGASVIYGPSNCGKSFWMLDIAAHVAAGRSWRDGDHEVDGGAVIYVALEGNHGFRSRVKAMMQAGRLSPSDPLFVTFDPVSLLTPGHAEILAATVRECGEKAGLPVRLVVLDTMARAMAGGDENSGADMTAAVAAIDAVRAATGAHVAVVHHSGKDELRGARGHSSLRAAVDTEIEITRREGEMVSTVRVTKQRDLERGPPLPFSLVAVPIGVDRRGKTLTSCLVKHEDEMMARQPKKMGATSRYQAADLLESLPANSTAEWLQAAAAAIGISRARFFVLRSELFAEKLVRIEAATGRTVRESVS